MKYYWLFLLLIGLLVLVFLVDIVIGSVSLFICDVWNIFIGSNDNFIYWEIILNYWFFKVLIVILVGVLFFVVGVLM